MFSNKTLCCLLGAGALAVLPGAFPAPAYAARAQAGAHAPLGDEDREMMEDIAYANLSEIETGKLALEKSQSDAVKAFAQKMVDDHGRAQKELAKLARARGVILPTQTDVQYDTLMTALRSLNGGAFNDEYIKRVGIGDHQRMRELLQQVGRDAKDAQLKAYANKTAKILGKHLGLAQKIEDGDGEEGGN
jgi:putative membrane protein